MTDHLTAWLERVEGKLDALTPLPEQMRGISKRLDEHIDRDEQIFHGNNGTPGLIREVDRLKQWRKSLYFLVAFLGTAAAGDFLSWIFGKK
ncbi:MAG: hypothetical protein WBW93_16490 [Steroidobacteraceae bacterium]